MFLIINIQSCDKSNTKIVDIDNCIKIYDSGKCTSCKLFVEYYEYKNSGKCKIEFVELDFDEELSRNGKSYFILINNGKVVKKSHINYKSIKEMKHQINELLNYESR